MNFPNILTLSRVLMMFIIVGLLTVGGPTVVAWALALFILAAFTDWLDGWYARKCGIVSDFGKLMDALADKILMVGLFVAFLALQMLTGWALFGVLIILTREFFITGLRLIAVSRGVVLAAERSGKIKTVLQIVAAGLLILAEWIYRASVTAEGSRWADHLQTAGEVGFGIAVLLTITSGTGYLIKYRGLLTDSTN